MTADQDSCTPDSQNFREGGLPNARLVKVQTPQDLTDPASRSYVTMWKP